MGGLERADLIFCRPLFLSYKPVGYEIIDLEISNNFIKFAVKPDRKTSHILRPVGQCIEGQEFNTLYLTLNCYVMENQKIDSFLSIKGEYFPSANIQTIRERLAATPDSKSDLIRFYEYKNPTVMLLISIFLGQLGIDRFMLGDIGLGVLKLITAGGCGIWWLVDLFTVQDRTREYNYKKFIEILW